MAEWWGKLTAADAHALADVIATFPRSKVGPWSRMLLTLFSTSRDGIVTAGRGTLAEAAEVTPRMARRFIERMEQDGVLVRLGDADGPSGHYERRAFEWRIDGEGWPESPSKGPGDGPQKGHPLDQIAAKRARGGGPNRRQKGHHQSTEYSDRVGAGSPGGDQPPNRQTEWPEIPPAIAAWHKAHADEIRAGWL